MEYGIALPAGDRALYVWHFGTDTADNHASLKQGRDGEEVPC